MSRALAIALVLLLEGSARGADGGADVPLRVASVRRGELELDDGRHVSVDGGVWFCDDVALARSRDLVRLDAENRAFKAGPPPMIVPPLPFAVTVVVVAIAAFVGGYFTPHP